MTVLWSMECSRTHPQLLLHTSGSCAVRTPCVSSCPFFSILTSAVFPLALDSSAVSHLVLLPPLPAPLKPTQNNFFFVYLAASGQLRHMGSLLYYAEFFIAVHRLSCSTGMWDLSSLTRDQTHFPCLGRQILNHWTTRRVPSGASGLVSSVRVPGHELPSCKPGGLRPVA